MCKFRFERFCLKTFPFKVKHEPDNDRFVTGLYKKEKIPEIDLELLTDV